jgi:hypothetical protein
MQKLHMVQKMCMTQLLNNLSELYTFPETCTHIFCVGKEMKPIWRRLQHVNYIKKIYVNTQQTK